MTYRRIRVLAVVARDARRRLDDDGASEGTPSAASAERRQDLKTTAKRTRSRVAAARARKSHPNNGEGR